MSRELSELKEEVGGLDSLRNKLEESAELKQLLTAEPDAAAEQELARDLKNIDQEIKRRERLLRFDGPHDKADAIITIQAGAGGTDAQDWAEMLERMYLRWAQSEGRAAKIIDRSPGEEAGIKHSLFEIGGRYAYGVLKNEHGVHRLVRQSPFNADSLRHTSFAKVEVLPKLSAKEAPALDPADLKIDTYRASGAGGQHVNKTSSAVRIRHLPTNTVVQCQNERSQAQNKAQAMAVLRSKLQIMAEQQQAEKIQELKGSTGQAAWGNQIRSYVLHPYQLVKDHRHGVEDKNVEQVLDGNLSTFLDVV